MATFVAKVVNIAASTEVIQIFLSIGVPAVFALLQPWVFGTRWEEG